MRNEAAKLGQEGVAENAHRPIRRTVFRHSATPATRTGGGRGGLS